jgi:hypothetical protein
MYTLQNVVIASSVATEVYVTTHFLTMSDELTIPIIFF